MQYIVLIKQKIAFRVMWQTAPYCLYGKDKATLECDGSLRWRGRIFAHLYTAVKHIVSMYEVHYWLVGYCLNFEVYQPKWRWYVSGRLSSQNKHSKWNLFDTVSLVYYERAHFTMMAATLCVIALTWVLTQGEKRRKELYIILSCFSCFSFV